MIPKSLLFVRLLNKPLLDRNRKGRSVQKDIIEQRQQQQDAGVRVPGPETVDLKRSKYVATIEQSQQRVAAEHHSRQRNPRKNYPNAQTIHVSTIEVYARNIRQSLLSKTPVLFADHPNHERVSADGVVVWPCLRRRVKPNRPSDETDGAALMLNPYIACWTSIIPHCAFNIPHYF